MKLTGYINKYVIYPPHDVIVVDIFRCVQKLKYVLMVLHTDEDWFAY